MVKKEEEKNDPKVSILGTAKGIKEYEYGAVVVNQTNSTTYKDFHTKGDGIHTIYPKNLTEPESNVSNI